MSDIFGPDGDDEAGTTPPPPPPPPPAQTPIEHVLTLDSEAEVTSSSSGIGGRAVAGIVGALLLVGGAVFAITQMGSSGPGSAEAAVAELLEAAGNEDLVGMMAALDPGERDALRGPVEDMFSELERLEVLDESFDLAGVSGVDFEFVDLTYRTEPVRDGLTRVYLTGGTVTSSIDADELPIGAFITDTVERFGGEIGGFQDSGTSNVSEGPDDEVFLVAREGGDGWRVSVGYTIAEIARLEAGQPLLASGIEPVGADSPEAAVEGMLGALTGFDLRDAVARLSPNEFAALHDYADLFLGEAEADLAEARDEFEITIDDISLRSDGGGDTATVFVDSIAVSVTADGLGLSVSIDDECISIDGDVDELDLVENPFADGPVCAEDLEDLGNDMFADIGLDAELEEDLLEFPEIETPDIGITTHRVDGEWYVAPIATGLDAMVSGLEVLERDHLDAMVDFVEQFFLGFGFGTSMEFEEVGESIGGFEDPSDVVDSFPTTTFIPGTPTGSFDEESLTAFLEFLAGDEEQVACMRARLDQVDDGTIAEILDAFDFDYEPSIESQDAFFGAINSCF